MAAFDTRALTRRPTLAEAHELRQRARAGEFGQRPNRVVTVMTVALYAFVIGMFASPWLILSLLTGPTNPFEGADPLVLGLVGVGAVVVGALAVRAAIHNVRRRNDWMPLALFARDNDLAFYRRSANPRYPGLLFWHGASRVAVDHVWSSTGLLADAGAYEYTTSSTDNETHHRWHFVAFRLPRALPHIVLDAFGNVVGNLPSSPNRGQRVSLGDPFDSRFALYVPSGYAADAFRLFPPDLMASLMDLPDFFDIEIVDSWLFLYSRYDLDVASPDTWRLLEFLEANVVTRLAAVADRYSDDRIVARPAPGSTTVTVGHPGIPLVAPEGRRLKSTLGAGVVGFVLILVLIVSYQAGFFSFVSDLLRG